MKSVRYLFSILIAAMILLGFQGGVSSESNVVSIDVADYGAVPDDGMDDSSAIQAAFEAAIAANSREVRFQSGRYDFSSDPIGGTGRDAYLCIEGAYDLKISGAVDSEGGPATQWVRFNTGESAADLRQLLFVCNSSRIRIENLIVDNDPYYYSAGTVVSIEGRRVTVEVLEGHPRSEGMKAFLPGLYDFGEKRFIRQRLIWSVADGSNSPVLHIAEGGNGRRMYVDSMDIAYAAKVGDGLFWFQGNFTPSAQMLMNFNVRGLEYENIRILNATGFALTADFCRDITYRNVSLAPEGNRIATAPRDGFHIANASGNVLMDHITIDGICDDGQNCRGVWTTMHEKIDDHTVLANAFPSGYSQMPLVIGSKMKMTRGDTMEYMWEGTIARYNVREGGSIEIVFLEALPADIAYSLDGSKENRSMLEPLCWYPDSYIVRDSTIRNTYRGLKIANTNVQVFGNTFEYNEYDIFLGAQNDASFFEGRHPADVIIRNNTFRQSNSGTGILLDLLSFRSLEPAPLMTRIDIFDNSFFDQKIGIEIRHTRDSNFYDNTFVGCGTGIKVSADSTTGLVLSANRSVAPTATQSPSPTAYPTASAPRYGPGSVPILLASMTVLVLAGLAWLIMKRKGFKKA